MKTPMNRRSAPSYGSGFDKASGLVAPETSRRWFTANSPDFAAKPKGGQRP